MCLYPFDLLLYPLILISFILPHLPYAAKFGEVYANMWNCNASEILSDYADVLAEAGTCLQEVDEDREFARMRDVSSHGSEYLPFFSFVVRSASPSVIVSLWREFWKSSFRVALVEKSMTLEQIDLCSKIVINDTRKEDVLQCRLYYLMVYPKAL